MEVKKQKSVRFRELVKTFGQPEEATLWTEPEQDRGFMKAVREKRIVTIVQRNIGTKKDYGLVGFIRQSKAAFLVFKKPLTYPAETKVVGIDYSAIAPPVPSGSLYKPRPQRRPGTPMRERPSAPRKREEKEKKLKLHTFRANLEITAKQTIPIEVKAKSVSEAATLLQKEAEAIQLDTEGSQISRKISAPKMK